MKYMRDKGEFVKQETFANVATIPLYYRYVTKTNIISGFMRTGLFPFNDEEPDYSKIIANSAQKAPTSAIIEGIDQGINYNLY